MTRVLRLAECCRNIGRMLPGAGLEGEADWLQTVGWQSSPRPIRAVARAWAELTMSDRFVACY